MPSTIQLADLVDSVPSLMYWARIDPTGSARISSTFGAALREMARQAGHRAGRAAAEHDRVELAFHLRQDFRAGALFVRARIVRIAELVDEIRAGRFARDVVRPVLVVLRVALGDIRTRQHDFRAHRLEIEDLLAAHLVGHDQDQPITFLLRDEGEADAGVAGGAFDERVAGLDLAGALGGFDHRQADAILDRTARIGAFELEEKFADAAHRGAAP